jgi:hypothetical protein
MFSKPEKRKRKHRSVINYDVYVNNDSTMTIFLARIENGLLVVVTGRSLVLVFGRFRICFCINLKLYSLIYKLMSSTDLHIYRPILKAESYSLLAVSIDFVRRAKLFSTRSTLREFECCDSAMFLAFRICFVRAILRYCLIVFQLATADWY